MMIDKKKWRNAAVLKYSLCTPLFTLMLGISAAIAQTDTTKTQKQTEMVVVGTPGKSGSEVYTKVDKSPEYPGGIQKFYEFLGHNLRYPAKMREKNIQGRVLLTFIIEEDGSLSNFEILRDVGYGAGEETLRVMAQSPKWVPASQGGHVVRSQFTIPVMFTLPSDSKKG